LKSGSGILIRTALFAVAAAAFLQAPAAGQTPRPGADAVARLIQRLANGETKLTFRDDERKLGYLPSLLEQLGILPDSQVLVFSKTSFQQDLISPRTPRALYFNDDVTIGFVQNGVVLELTANDPVLGVQFYTLDAPKTDKPVFLHRDAECAKCHNGVNRGLPGLVVAATYTAADGTGFYLGTKSLFTATDHRTPFEDRWGGWYVNGTHGRQFHNGNAVAPDTDHPFDLDRSASLNLTSLRGRIDTARYFESASDIVALMTLEHQTEATNLITGLNSRTQIPSQMDVAIDELLAYLLFIDEAPFAAPIKGVSTFTQTFPQRGPRDSQGRSLRDFDLQTRLFRYPLSYMVYSEAFNAIRAPVRERLYQRLYSILTGHDRNPRYARLSADSREAILGILRDTKTDLPDSWRVPGTP